MVDPDETIHPIRSESDKFNELFFLVFDFYRNRTSLLFLEK